LLTINGSYYVEFCLKIINSMSNTFFNVLIVGRKFHVVRYSIETTLLRIGKVMLNLYREITAEFQDQGKLMVLMPRCYEQ